MRSIRSRIMIIMMFSIVLTAIVSSVLLTRFSYDAFRNESLDKMTNMVSRYADGFDYNLQKVKDIAINVENMVLSLMNLSDMRNDASYLDDLELKLAPVIEGYAKQGIRTKSAYVFFSPELDGSAHDVWFADLDGNGVIRQEEFDISFYDEFNETEDWYFIPKETLQPFWTNPYAGNADYDAHIIYISYTRPIVIDDQFIGITGSDYHFNIMKDDINAISIYDTGYAILLDENFDILVHPTLEINSNLADFQDGEYDYINDAMREKDQGYFEYTWVDGSDKILVFKRLSNGWTFGMTVQEKEVFKWLYQTIGIMIATSVVIIIFIGLLAYKLTGYLTDSLTHLGKQVKTIGEGDYDHPISKDIIHKKDETGELANNIEVMRLRQKESFEALQKYNENLENEIEIRTRSLKESNEKLEVSLYDNEEKNRILHEMNQQLNAVIKDMETTKRQLIESEKLASISMLATRLAHEFNTPVGNMTTLVTFIKSITNNIDKQLVDNNLKKQDLKDYLGKVDESLNLTFDNIQTIQMLVAKFKELDPTSHVTIQSKIKMCDFLSMVISSIPYNPDRIKIEVICQENLMVRLDSGKLSSVIYHLIENAIVHGLDDLSEGLIVIDVRIINEELRISVKDNGVGMSKEMLDHIFVPFYSGSLSKNFSGLGLNIVYNIVTEVFNGQVECISEENQFTEFIIRMKLE